MTNAELVELVKSFPLLPGIYKFLNKDKKVIYVGKAKSIKKRVMSYTRAANLSQRIQQMVFWAETIVCETTLTEMDALILEAKLIKELQPKYNILLKDDKDYPYLIITKTHSYPRILKYRGKGHLDDYRKGPFVSAKALYDLTKEITKLFKIRTCTDYTFKTRKRPCIEYFLNKCTAPCVDYISPDEYKANVDKVCKFLEGQNKDIVQKLTLDMKNYSAAMEYEKAASLRDQIKILSSYVIDSVNLKNTHIIIKLSSNKRTIVKVFFYNNNINYGTKDFFFNECEDDILESFIKQFYIEFPSPKAIWLNEKIKDTDLISKTYKTKISFVEAKNARKNIIHECLNVASIALETYIKNNDTNAIHIDKIKSIFDLNKSPKRIEVIDNSHFFGKNAFGCVIVFDDMQFKKKDYRAYKIQSDNTMDDYQMMKEVIERRYLKKDAVLPDLLLIDGGMGQFNAVFNFLEDHGLAIDIVAIAKGVYRNAFDETFNSHKVKDFKFEKGDKTLFFLERLRDEAHNFAIKNSRKSFEQTFQNSELSNIKELSKDLIKNLYESFKNIEEIKNASEEELLKVKGMSYNLCKRLKKFFQDQNVT